VCLAWKGSRCGQHPQRLAPTSSQFLLIIMRENWDGVGASRCGCCPDLLSFQTSQTACNWTVIGQILHSTRTWSYSHRRFGSQAHNEGRFGVGYRSGTDGFSDSGLSCITARHLQFWEGAWKRSLLHSSFRQGALQPVRKPASSPLFIFREHCDPNAAHCRACARFKLSYFLGRPARLPKAPSSPTSFSAAG